jgi:hypothetical protein
MVKIERRSDNPEEKKELKRYYDEWRNNTLKNKENFEDDFKHVDTNNNNNIIYFTKNDYFDEDIKKTPSLKDLQKKTPSKKDLQKNEYEFSTYEQRRLITERNTRRFLTDAFNKFENSSFINYFKNFFKKKNHNINNRNIRGRNNRYNLNYYNRNRYDRNESFISYIIDKWISFRDSFYNNNSEEQLKQNDEIMGKDIGTRVDRYLSQIYIKRERNLNRNNIDTSKNTDTSYNILIDYLLDILSFFYNILKNLLKYFI